MLLGLMPATMTHMVMGCWGGWRRGGVLLSLMPANTLAQQRDGSVGRWEGRWGASSAAGSGASSQYGTYTTSYLQVQCINKCALSSALKSAWRQYGTANVLCQCAPKSRLHMQAPWCQRCLWVGSAAHCSGCRPTPKRCLVLGAVQQILSAWPCAQS